MIEIKPKEKPIIGNVKDMPKKEQAIPQPRRRARKNKTIHTAFSGNNKTALIMGLAGLAAAILADHNRRTHDQA